MNYISSDVLDNILPENEVPCIEEIAAPHPPACAWGVAPLLPARGAWAESALEEATSLRIRTFCPLPTPAEIKAEFPLSMDAAATVGRTRRAVQEILAGIDDRLLVITGPCAIHDEASAIEYAERLRELRRRISDKMLLVMRVSLERTPTGNGWKGLIHDPLRDGRGNFAVGFHAARRILTRINELGVPAASELLSPMAPAYLEDLLSWAFIGAGAVESQTHRQLVSGLSTPVGFHVGTGDKPDTAVNAVMTALNPHAFLGISQNGRPTLVRSSGNPWTHPIASGEEIVDEETERMAELSAKLEAKGLPCRIVIDCAGDGSALEGRQGEIFHGIIDKRQSSGTAVVGLMLKSHLHGGRQPFLSAPSPLKYGVSITNACISWEETESLIDEAYDIL